MQISLLIVDPLTLVGRELLSLLEQERGLVGEVAYRHSDIDQEHQIAELAGEPALVPPLADGDDFSDVGAVVVASETDSSRLDVVERFMESNPATPVVVIGGAGRPWERTEPCALPKNHWPERHVRVAHPALVGTSILASALRYLEPRGGSVAAVDPVSSRGREAIELLARQATQRLSGAPVQEMIAHSILAFNLVASADDELTRDATVLLPDLDLTVTRSLSGCFHGHAAHIGLDFAQPVDEHELEEAIDSDLRIFHSEPPLALDRIIDADQVAMMTPQLSRDRYHLGVTMMIDGLRVGGATTALEILRSMLGSGS
jgi:aspartate-semialdehyde dehydrogenase